MADIRTVLLAIDFREDLMAQLESAFAPARVIRASFRDDAAIAAAMEEADVAVLPGDLDDRILAGPHLRWVHCCHAGLNKSARPEVFARDIAVTGSAGRSAPSLAEHAFFFMLALTYDAYGLKSAQENREWSGFARRYAAGRGLNGQTVGIVGYGNTGRAVARRARAFDMRVLVYSRSVREKPEDVDAYFAADAGDSLDPLLAESDYLVLCCLYSDETRRLIDRAALAKMKPTARLINMARGGVVDQAALIDALREGRIAGAGCDVFEEEPIPADDPIWQTPNLIITPHATPRVADFEGSSAAPLLENIRRYRAGEPMVNQLLARDVLTP